MSAARAGQLAPPDLELIGEIREWMAKARAHNKRNAEFRAPKHSTSDVIAFLTAQHAEAAALLSVARMLFLMSAGPMAEREPEREPEPMPLSGCTCEPIRGSHRPPCVWAAQRQ